ncbi:probable ubiquitin-conjugating enzyme E2 24 isoform X1 [Sesamum indicum]|uniref:Probable ubiquitin-conjugating enzyme E2 24 isoform X1 n=1 Tax=Sesamum indicum TaxID=4182 RepID=A0A8M8V6A2_SESIN|nr:probable ubiquitin-conjugating enzyme E2 24 isoform X1 [Sesamum indicum]
MDSLLSDFDSFSDSSSSEDQEDIESLYGGQACTIFSSLEETIEKIDDFLLFERGFLHGDIVCLVSEPLGQMGKVINVEMTVDLEKIDGSKIRNVSSRDLQRIRSLSVGDYVVQGAWLGKVEKIVDHVTILFDDGTKCKLTVDGPEKIVALSPDIVEDPQYPFYPGQRVQIESSSVSRSTRWLCGIRKDKHEQGIVSNVDAGLVYVDWLGCAVIEGEKGPAPARLQDSRNLSVLSSFPHANWQLGDWCVIPLQQSLPSVCASRLVKQHKQSEMISQSGDLTPNFQQIAVIVKTKTKLDVQWQDGSRSMGLDSHMLFPVNIVDAHDFWADSFVLEKGTADDSEVPGFQRWGVVRSVDPKERTVKVKWCKSSLNLLDSKEEQMEETVSAYELVEHPDYSYGLGEVVFRTDKSIVDLGDVDRERSCTISEIYMGEDADLKGVEIIGDQIKYLKDKFLSYFGTVVGFKHGDVEVKWATGATTKVAPYEIYKVDKCEGTTTPELDDDNVQPPNEEPQVKNQLLGQKLKDTLGLDCDNAKESTSNFISQVAIGVFSSITSSLFGSLTTSLISGYKYTSDGGQINGKPPAEESLELCNLNLGEQFPVVDDLEMPEKITPLQIKEANENIMMPSSSKNPESFRQFDMVNDCSDHHFVKESGMDLHSAQVKRGWLKKVHQEWSILEKDLPETIYVRVYEERMDLVRAAIVGTAGTPYHDGLFFFDICIPPQYPNEPPMVYYNSGGLRINPNLYESGRVCLSLLNTWAGSQSEVWNPGSSTILQVLLSLQALVLNEKPYFNEAGYDTQIGKAEGEKNSVSYNENAFLVSCRSMLYLLRKPPKMKMMTLFSFYDCKYCFELDTIVFEIGQHFEALVDEHFSRRSRNILLACKAYIQGAPIGHSFNSEDAEQETQKGSSTGFKIMLSKLYSRLVEAFLDKGFDCSNLSDQVP